MGLVVSLQDRAGGSKGMGDGNLRVVTNTEKSEGPTDEMLVRRTLDGDKAAYGLLVARYQTRIHSFVFRYLGNAADAEDLTQEVFIRAYRNLHRFRGEAKFSTWLYQIAKNMAFNKLREFKRRVYGWLKPNHTNDEGEPLIEQIASDDRDPESLLEGRESNHHVQKAIAELNPVWRAALILRDIEEMSYEEIGEILGLAQGTVKSRIHRARSQLKEKLAWYYE